MNQHRGWTINLVSIFDMGGPSGMGDYLHASYSLYLR